MRGHTAATARCSMPLPRSSSRGFAKRWAARRAWFSHRMKGAAAVQGIAPLKHHVNQSARPEWPVNLYPRTEILRRQEVIELLFSAFAILRASCARLGP